jgi:hypothetical protein
MRMKQVTTTMALLLLAFAGTPFAADERSGKPAEQSPRAITTESGTEIIIRSDTDRRRRDAENSNPQSGLDSTHGLERAAERRAEPADVHSQAGGAAEPEGGMYEYFFGRRQDADAKSESSWYDYLFGGRKKDKAQEDGEESRWWWPFD